MNSSPNATTYLKIFIVKMLEKKYKNIARKNQQLLALPANTH